jgi:hypothetical protein
MTRPQVSRSHRGLNQSHDTAVLRGLTVSPPFRGETLRPTRDQRDRNQPTTTTERGTVTLMSTATTERPPPSSTQETSPTDAVQPRRPTRTRRTPTPPPMAPRRRMPRNGHRDVLPRTWRTNSRSQEHLRHLHRPNPMPRSSPHPMREVRSVGRPRRTPTPPTPRRMEPSTSRAAALRDRRERRTLSVTNLGRGRGGVPPREAGRPGSRGAARSRRGEFRLRFWMVPSSEVSTTDREVGS